MSKIDDVLAKANRILRNRRKVRQPDHLQEQIDAGYNLVYALMHDPIFVEMKQLSMQLPPDQQSTGLSRSTLRAIKRAIEAYGVQL